MGLNDFLLKVLQLPAIRDSADYETLEGLAAGVEGELSGAYVEGTDSGWQTPTLGGTWANFGSGFQGARYRKIGKVVYIEGLIASGTINTAAFQLPVGYRPVANLMLAAYSDGAALGRLDIGSTGDVVPVAGATSFFSITCSFSVAAV